MTIKRIFFFCVSSGEMHVSLAFKSFLFLLGIFSLESYRVFED